MPLGAACSPTSQKGASLLREPALSRFSHCSLAPSSSRTWQDVPSQTGTQGRVRSLIWTPDLLVLQGGEPPSEGPQAHSGWTAAWDLPPSLGPESAGTFRAQCGRPGPVSRPPQYHGGLGSYSVRCFWLSRPFWSDSGLTSGAKPLSNG